MRATGATPDALLKLAFGVFLPRLISNFPLDDLTKGNILRLQFFKRLDQWFATMLKLLGSAGHQIY